MKSKGLVLLTMGFCSIALANYRTPTENTELLEDAMSGGAAIAIDATTNFFNPAGLTRIDHPQIIGVGKAIRAETRFSGTSAGIPGNTKSITNALAPAFHFSAPIFYNLIFGISVTSPWGSSTEYPIGSVAQFVSTKSSLQTVDVGPSLAYRFDPHFSIGAGPNAQFARLVANVMFPPLPPPFTAELKNTASDWAYGWHAGALYEFNPCTRVGLNYRSKIRHTLTGRSSYPFVPNGHLSVSLPLPAITTASIYHAFNPTWAIMGTIDYTQWNILQNIVLRNSAVSPLVVVPQNFHNTVRYALGGEYHYSPILILRAGLSYEPTPMNNRDRSITLPVTDSLIVGFGGHYQAYPTVGVDAGYIHIFSKRAAINNTSLGITTIGNADNTINALSMQLTYDVV